MLDTPHVDDDNKPDDAVKQRLRRVVADDLRRARPAANATDTSLDARLMIEFVSDQSRSAIAFVEVTKRIGFPDAKVAWSTGAASLYLELLSRVPTNDANELAQLASAFVSKSDETKEHVAASRETIDVALSMERQRIEALLPKKLGQQNAPEQPQRDAGLVAPTRDSAKERLDSFDVRIGELDDLADRLTARMTDLQQWWKLAEVARAARDVINRSTRPVGAADANSSEPLLNLHAAVVGLCAVLHETALKPAGPSPAAAPTVDAQVRATVDEHAATLSGSVQEFLNLPRQEAWAHFKRMLDNVGTHPLLSIGALGGLVGLFAYAKALAELGNMNLSPVGLITSGDITDFALRLAPAFLLSCVAALLIVAFWVVALACNQRKPWSFVGALAGCGLLLLIVYTWLIRWTPPPAYLHPDALGVGLASASLAVLFPVVMLFRAGRRRGVHDDDVWQRRILRLLRMLSDSRGLLLLFIVLGLAVLSSERFSVLFARGASRLAQEPPSLVLETKLYEHPILIYPTFSRLSTVWIIQRGDSVAPQQVSRDKAPWSIVASSEVACVRPQTAREQETKSLTNSCTNARTPSEFLQDTIAGYATTFFRCARASFSDRRPIAVMRFATGAPETAAAISAQPLLQSTAEKLAVPSLVGLLDEEHENTFDFVNALHGDPYASLVVLGFASTTGPTANNANLSERRALALQRSLLIAAGYTEESAADFRNRIHSRGLGEDLLSGLFGTQDASRDQVAVAFLCDRR